MVASKLSQILQLTPTSEIIFQGPFNQVVTSYLELKNPSDYRICFKVKTTAPKRYCVRPNSGIVEPDGKIKIAIMLQPMDPSEFNEWNKHKFMVQSTVLNETGFVKIEEVFDSTKPEEFMDSKLRCVFKLATSTEQTASKERQETGAAEQTLAQDVAADPVSTATAATIATGTTTTTPSQQQQAARHQKQGSLGSGKSSILSSTSGPITTSMPMPSRVTSSSSSISKAWESGDRNARRSDIFEQQRGDKSLASSQNLTSSFLQPMNDDYKIVLVSLAMLFLGVILGKYII